MTYNILHIDSMKGMTTLNQRYNTLSSPAPSLVSGQVYMFQSDKYLQETRGARIETCVNVKYRCQNATMPSGDHWLITLHGNNADITNPIAGLRLNADGSLEVRQRQSGHEAQLGITAAGVIALNTDYTIEFLFKSSTSAVGRFILAVDGVTLLSVSGIVTAYGAGNASWVLGSTDTSGTPFDVNDYFWDTTVTGSSSGTAAMIGPTTYYQLVPTGAGASTDLTPNTGANWAAVDDMPVDLDSTFVFLNTSGTARDSYIMSDLPGGAPPVAAVASRSAIRSLGSGTWTAEIDLLTDGTYRRVGGIFAVGSVTSPIYRYYAVDPPDVLRGDGGAWDAAWLNRSEIGIVATLISGSPVSGAHVSQIHLDVCCAGVPTVVRQSGYALIVG